MDIKDVKVSFASFAVAGVAVDQTVYSRSTSPVRRFDCQPALEIRAALDFKYPSYRVGKAGYQSLIICMCRRRVFVMWQMQL